MQEKLFRKSNSPIVQLLHLIATETDTQNFHFDVIQTSIRTSSYAVIRVCDSVETRVTII